MSTQGNPGSHSHSGGYGHDQGAGHGHSHGHSHEPGHSHGGEHGHNHGEGHSHDSGIAQKILHFFGLGHSHSYVDAALDKALTTNEQGIRAVKISMAALLITALLQIIVVVYTGSVALLADTVHNFSDALTALPLWLAFWLARRARNNRYTYGYGRAEDLAGTIIVLMILFSAIEIFYQAYDRIVNPRPIENLGWLAAAAIVGFIGNELVALFRLRVGRQIGSAALIADGLHARADGFTSLGVLAGAVGVWLGFPLADPIAALIIGLVILGIVATAARDMWYRLMDAVDPEMTEKFESVARVVPGVIGVQEASLRWVGHRQRGELHVQVDCNITTAEGHTIAEEVRHALFHAIPELVTITVHVDPCVDGSSHEFHAITAHHLPGGNGGANGNGHAVPPLAPPPGKEYAAIMRPAEGIQIIDDITRQFGVETLEGRIGPLLQGVGARAQFIEMPAGLHLYEHPHPTEAIIYTVRGSWVAVTDGQRHQMQPGSLLWFGPNIAAGYEVPFDDPAFILIFKGERGIDAETFVGYLENELTPSLIEERANGGTFLIRELPEDHPARIFAAALAAEKA